MKSGTIRLLDQDGKIVKQARYKIPADQERFKESCRKLYAASVLKKCKFDLLDDGEQEKKVKDEFVKHQVIIKQKSPWKKGKGLLGRNSSGKKIPFHHPNRYY